MIYMNECPQCGGPNEVLGILGSLIHFRCRNCGSNTNRLATDSDVKEMNDELSDGQD